MRNCCANSAILFMAFVVGCGAESADQFSSSNQSEDLLVMAEGPAAGDAAPAAPADGAAEARQPEHAGGAVGVPAALQQRKIIFNATIALRVDDLDDAFKQLFQLVEQSGGYISSSSANGNAGSARSGEWMMRIPGGGFSGFTRDVAGLGEVVTNSMTSQEVTAEFHDLEARIRNKQQEEMRLQDFLDNSTAKLEDILKVENEITRVRGEVESMQGRLRVLADLTSLSTVTVRMSEVVDFVPPVLASEPAFGDQISSTWNSTVESMTDLGKAFVLLVIAVVPWVVVFGVPSVVVCSLVRWRFRISRAVVTP